MAGRVRVSVALCTYEGQRFIGEQIASILTQTRPVDEIVLGDDSPSEKTLTIVTQMLEGLDIDLVIRRHQPGLGVRANFSDAISATTGDVVFLCDQDDVWERDKVEKLVSALDEVELVHTDATLIDAQGNCCGPSLLAELRASSWERENLQNGDALAVLLKRNLVTGATVAVRGDFAREAMPVPQGWIHDEWLALLAALDHSLRLLPQAFTRYRQHDANQIGAKKATLMSTARRMLSPEAEDDHRRLIRALNAVKYAQRNCRGSAKDRARLAEAAHHQRVRSLMPTGRFSRIVPVLREAASGRYSRCSRGIVAIGRDLVQAK